MVVDGLHGPALVDPVEDEPAGHAVLAAGNEMIRIEIRLHEQEYEMAKKEAKALGIALGGSLFAVRAARTSCLRQATVDALRRPYPIRKPVP